MKRSKSGRVNASPSTDLDRSSMISAPLTRAVQIIDAVAVASDGLALNKIASLVELPPSTTYRLVRSLVAVGYLALNEQEKRYYIGRRLMQVMHSAFGGKNIQAVAQPILARLVSKFGQVFYINQLISDRARVVAFVMPQVIERPLVIPGEYSPIHATASGKAIFAYQDWSVIDRQLSEPLQKFLPNTITNPAAVRKELERVRRNGYAMTRSEYGMGVSAIAVPVEISNAGVLYSIAVAGFQSQLFAHHTINVYVTALQSAATEFKRSMSAVHEVDGRIRMTG